MLSPVSLGLSFTSVGGIAYGDSEVPGVQPQPTRTKTSAIQMVCGKAVTDNNGDLQVFLSRNDVTKDCTCTWLVIGGTSALPNNSEPNTDQLLEQIRTGDGQAVDRLFSRHRDRLRQMISVRMDPRLAARVDPSDVVQDTLIVAAHRLDDYLAKSPVPFYPWLRQIAWNRLIDLQRQHVRAKSRSVEREQTALDLSEASVAQFVDQLVTSSAGPYTRALREEMLDRLRMTLGELPDEYREVLVLRHLEKLSTRETANVLGIAEGATKMRHMRAMKSLKERLDKGERYP